MSYFSKYSFNLFALKSIQLYCPNEIRYKHKAFGGLAEGKLCKEVEINDVRLR